METITNPSDILSLMCSAKKRWGLYISFDPRGGSEIFKAAPYLGREEFFQVQFDGFGYVFFDTEAAMLELYNQTVGDEGPTETNPYNGKASVFAMTCDPLGEVLTHNT